MMGNNLLLYGVIYPVAAAALLAVLAGLGPRRPRGWWPWAIVAAGVLASVARLIFVERSGTWGIDHRIFWDVGADAWAGEDPYAPDRYPSHPFLNPPSTFAFFALVAALPFRASLVLWGLINSVLAFAIVPLSAAALDDRGEGGRRALTAAEIGLLATAVALSDACMATIQLGQLALIATALILVALVARSHDRPLSAGVALGLATMKIGTMVPFLLLFLRRRDRKAWLALGLTVIALLILGGQPTRMPEQAGAMLRRIGELSRPGAVNDISYAGPYDEWIIGLDHLAYRLGIRDAGALKAIQAVGVLGIGIWLAVELYSRRIPYGLGISLMSLYSVVFLYHRLYDAVMIVPALVYAVGRARSSAGRSRWLFGAATILMLTVLYMRRKALGHLTGWAVAHHGPPASLVEWFVLPSADWSIVLAMVGLRLAEGWAGPGPSGETEAAREPGASEGG